jgi:hypothetical protein
VANAPHKRERPVATAWRWLKAEAGQTTSPFGLGRLVPNCGSWVLPD